jgi:release factor glutamine methyltransferase
LRAAGIDDARIEAEVLLQHVLGWSKAQLLARLHDPLSSDDLEAYQRLVQRRVSREPAAYIVGHREFYGLDLLVTPDVLIPRPETELVVTEALARARARHPQGGRLRLADVGTGSGAIAVALATHLPESTVYAIDLSPAALSVAAANAARLGVAERVHLLHGDLLRPLPVPVDLIAANLPYVSRRERETLQAEVREHEPALALFAGETGLEVITRFLALAPDALRPHGSIILEVGYGQAEPVAALARRHFPAATVASVKDLAGIDRVITIDT